MTSIRVKNARYHANNAVVKAREAAEDVRARAEGIRNSGHYSPEGVEEYVGGWVNQGKTSAGAAFETADEKVEEAREATERALREARAVSIEERAAAAAVLGPVISAATANNPKALIELYERRAPQSQAERFIIEEAAQAVVDAGLGDMAFTEQWGRTRTALADQVETPEERAAAEDLAALDGVEGYVAHAKRVVEGDLTTAETGSPEAYSVSNETSRFVVASYERGLDEGTVDAPVEHTPEGVPAASDA
jgi:hypothetical protein